MAEKRGGATESELVLSFLYRKGWCQSTLETIFSNHIEMMKNNKHQGWTLEYFTRCSNKSDRWMFEVFSEMWRVEGEYMKTSLWSTKCIKTNEICAKTNLNLILKCRFIYYSSTFWYYTDSNQWFLRWNSTASIKIRYRLITSTIPNEMINLAVLQISASQIYMEIKWNFHPNSRRMRTNHRERLFLARKFIHGLDSRTTMNVTSFPTKKSVTKFDL